MRIVKNKEIIYSSKIIKAGALLDDTKMLLANWDEELSVKENLDRIRHQNIFGKASRSRVIDITNIFRQRYLVSKSITNALVILIKALLPADELNPILYFHATQSDALLHDVVVKFLAPFQKNGKTNITIEEMLAIISQWVDEGKTTTQWSEITTLRVAQELMSTLRDFGILGGAVRKSLVNFYLPVKAFAYIAYYLRERQPSGEKLIADPEWELFFLSYDEVERLFMEAHQHHLLEYQAAGSTIRITFPARSIEDYAHVISNRTY